MAASISRKKHQAEVARSLKTGKLVLKSSQSNNAALPHTCIGYTGIF